MQLGVERLFGPKGPGARVSPLHSSQISPFTLGLGAIEGISII
ncbi:MAG: hypothetical protein Q8O86_10565 [Dehalococcoidia bacterium]|nr:hypothetical protein [Dehalococcoidia bacterium]